MKKQKYIISSNHEEITKYVTNQKGYPAWVTSAELLRIRFTDKYNPQIERITWEKFFRKFEASKLALLFVPTTRFNKFVKRK